MSATSEKYMNVKSFNEQREKEEFTAFFRRYYSSLLFYATRFLKEEQAEDVVQDAFMDLWHRRADLDMGDRIIAFMYRSVYTKALNKLKHEKIVSSYSTAAQEIHKKRVEYLSPDNNDVLRKIEDKELKKEVYSAIDILPSKCQEVFMLSYVHGLKNKEIAELMQISLKTVEAHMYKALKCLRVNLGHLTLLTIMIVITNNLL